MTSRAKSLLLAPPVLACNGHFHSHTMALSPLGTLRCYSRQEKGKEEGCKDRIAEGICQQFVHLEGPPWKPDPVTLHLQQRGQITEEPRKRSMFAF